MKKYIVIAAVAVVIIAGGLYGAKKYSSLRTARVHSSPAVVPVPAVTVVLNTGEEISTASGIAAENAYTALTAMAKQKNLTLTTKQYDFGIFVEQIGARANTKEKSWIYFVNGKSGTVASDKQHLNAGDTVEWKYMVPTIE